MWVGVLYLTNPAKASSKHLELLWLTAWLTPIWKQQSETFPWEGVSSWQGGKDGYERWGITDYLWEFILHHAKKLEGENRKLFNHRWEFNHLPVSKTPQDFPQCLHNPGLFFQERNFNIFKQNPIQNLGWPRPVWYFIFFHQYCLTHATFIQTVKPRNLLQHNGHWQESRGARF